MPFWTTARWDNWQVLTGTRVMSSSVFFPQVYFAICIITRNVIGSWYEGSPNILWREYVIWRLYLWSAKNSVFPTFICQSRHMSQRVIVLLWFRDIWHAGKSADWDNRIFANSCCARWDMWQGFTGTRVMSSNVLFPPPQPSFGYVKLVMWLTLAMKIPIAFSSKSRVRQNHLKRLFWYLVGFLKNVQYYICHEIATSNVQKY